MTSFKKLNIFCIFGIVFFLAGLLWNACHHGGDFRVFYLAGQRFLTQTPIYDAADGWSPFKYHPAWAVLFSAWSLLPFTVSALFFNLMNMGFWALAARSWGQLLGFKLTSTSFFVLVLLSLNAMSAETAYGQVNGFLFWGATQIFIWLESSSPKPFRSGFLLAVLISLKLNLAILLGYVLYKNWRSALGIFAGALSLHLVVLGSFWQFSNLGLYRSWLDLLLTQSRDQYNTFEVQSILRLCYIFFGESYAKTAWAVFAAFAVSLGVYLDKTKNLEKAVPPAALSGGYWLAMIFFLSPLAWWYQVLYLFPLAFLIIKTSTARHAQWLARACLCSFAFISFNTIGRSGIFNFKLYMGYFFAGLALWGYFLWSQLHRSLDSKATSKIRQILSRKRPVADNTTEPAFTYSRLS